MWLPWEIAAALAAGLVVALVATVRRGGRVATRIRPVGRELALVLALYALWQWAHERAVTKVAGARGHALWVFHLQRALHLPDERSLQRLLLPHRLLTEAANGYYAVAHVPAVIALLLWLFFRHRDRYGEQRTALALVTAACLALQTIPVAPPRLLPDLGFVDTGLALGQSVYGTGGSGISNQLAAMPSVHVAWALLVGWAAVTAGTGRGRWLVLAHPVLTVVTVSATANHWWLDGIVAGALLVAAVAVARRLAPQETRRSAPRRPGLAKEPVSAPTTVGAGLA